MRFTHLFILLIFFIFSGCKHKKLTLSKIEGSQIQITDSLIPDSEIEAYIKPFRDNIQKDLDSVLAYSADTYSKTDGELNTAIGNFMADAVYDEANPVFKSRTGHEIDMVLLNHGGIRSILSKGSVSKRTAFELMPFENSVVVVALKSQQIDSLINYLVRAKRAHPISNLKLTLDKDFNVIEAKIKGEPIKPDKTYYVATNDYLYNGGDNMTFFKNNDSLYVLNYKIRNALIDNFMKKDTIKPVRDDRFIQIK
ncbi:5'-nucleotidase C-terminal domain-containing protein [Sabulilitoribacter multivorans]|uniref:5'-nucleotidase C-terminal domain-containing protein n=1 Tax=Flaviramulus multivorans TaxID=1304750 RepID=A0ABS9IM58_9FLAO|nr:5'-nucleotidase [Flaviramulus multivorans]MCF7561692.1 5'-nucleotidase C-terminal domain-containing protein [Flaviramulus multivorans]